MFLAVWLVFLSALCPFPCDAFGKGLGEDSLQPVAAEHKLEGEDTHVVVNTAGASSDLNFTSKPTKESFIAAWESYQKSLPTTVTLKRTEEPSIYLYETSLFPFKGKLKITNVLISEDLDYYYDYNLNDDQALRGVVETEFVGASVEDLYKKYPYSLEIWKKGNFLFYTKDAGQWVSGKAYLAFQSERKNAVASTQSSGQKIWSDLLPLPYILLFFSVFWWLIRRSQKTQTVRVDLSMDRQLKALEIGEKSLVLQNEQTALLRQLAGKKEGG
jgi:hypothetical protein